MTDSAKDEPASQETLRDFAPEDLFLEQRITDLHLSPDGEQVVCALKSVDRDGDRYLSQLWRVPARGGPAVRLTRVPGLDRSPRWSPDGTRIAFISDRGGDAPQIHLLPADGGEASPLTRFGCAVVDLAWHPGGRHLAALCAINVDPDRHEDGAHELDLARPPRDKQAPEPVWRLPYKSDGQGYVLSSRLHLVLVDASSGDGCVLTSGDFDSDHFCWSPDGRQLAFGRTREDPREVHCSDLWTVEVDIEAGGAAGKPVKYSDGVSTATMPCWSPDGRSIAFMGARDGGDPIMRLWVCDTWTRAIRALGDDDIEAVPGVLQWVDDSRRLAFVQAWRGLQRIATIDAASGEVAVAIEPEAGQVALMAAGRDRVVYTEEGVDHPLELHAAAWTDADAPGRGCQAPETLTSFNAWWDERRAPRVERRTFQLPDGEGGEEAVSGWLFLPSGERQAMPLLVDVHGGPASYVAMQYSSTPHWQVLVSRGWAVLALDAVGSSSYGRAFSERLRGRWGELDFPQHEAAIDALQREGLAGERLAISGSSYGGYMAAWAIGHTRRFRAAVISAPVANLESHYGTSDSGYYADPFALQSRPQDNRGAMKRLSPVDHVDDATTPALLIQGKSDQRCPMGQSEELLIKLQRAGTASELVLYPGGSHHLMAQGRPSHRIDAVRRIVGWLERWAGG